MMGAVVDEVGFFSCEIVVVRGECKHIFLYSILAFCLECVCSIGWFLVCSFLSFLKVCSLWLAPECVVLSPGCVALSPGHIVLSPATRGTESCNRWSFVLPYMTAFLLFLTGRFACFVLFLFLDLWWQVAVWRVF